MGVYIKGFRKPTYCQECPLTFDYDCMIQHEQRDSLIDQYKHCPIVEVTEPHGRLIDEDEYWKIVNAQDTDPKYVGESEINDIFLEAWNDVPTVIEAEGERCIFI